MDTAQRIRAVALRTLLLALAAIAMMLGMWRECLVMRFLHIPCLTCGMTRSLLALLRLDWRESLHYHPLTVPFLIGFWALINREPLGISCRAMKWMTAALGVLLIAFWGYRMLSGPQSWAFLLAGR